MNSKVKKYLGPILGLSGSIMFLIAGIILIYGFGYLGSQLSGYFLIVCVFGLIGAIVGFISRRSASSCIMLLAGGIAFFTILVSASALIYFSIPIFIVSIVAVILLIFGGALDWRLDERLKKTTE